MNKADALGFVLAAVARLITGAQGQMEIALKRWIDPAQWGWYAGDPHIHAAGCAHYDVPTQGVSPETMIRHVRGEGPRPQPGRVRRAG